MRTTTATATAPDAPAPWPPAGRRAALAAGAMAAGWLALASFPGLELALFARGGAQLAGWLTGIPVERAPTGWLLLHPALPMAVTAKCSATDFFLMVAAVLGWHLGRPARAAWQTVPLALLAAVPVTLVLNALRLASLSFMHRRLIPQFPPAYEATLHLLTGVAVFLPGLLALHLLLSPRVHRTHPAA